MEHSLGQSLAGLRFKPAWEAILLTTSRDSDQRYSKSPVSLALGCLAALALTLIPGATETAVANGDTRTIYLHHAHTGEDIAATYLVNGQYDSRVLEQLNWFLRDWRRDEPTNMDPRLFDVVWEAYRNAGAGNQVINVVSAYRSPETNAMLRARSRAVAKYSQHMLGKAMDTTMPGMPMSQVREIGMRMQRGGVGYYPNANTPFVHLDVGNVRAWPRMTYEQLVRLFPDGKTVHLPTNGQPLPGYEEARAEIEARGNGAYVTAPPRRSFGGFLAALFGGGGEDEDAEIAAPPPSARKQWSALAPRGSRGAQGEDGGGEEGGAEEQSGGRRGRGQIARAEADLPRGETVMTATGAVAVAPQPARGAQTAAPVPPEDISDATPAEDGKRRHYANVPLPPRGRPASLENRTTETASLDNDPADLRPTTDAQADEGSEQGKRHYVSAPLPPRRPAKLVAATEPERANEREQKSRTAHALAPDAVSPESHAGQDDPALAYAPAGDSAAPEPEDAKPARASAQKGDLVPARLDRSNFNTLTAATPAARASARTVLGAPITGVRSAARAGDAATLLPPTRPAHLVGFSASATPPTNGFAAADSRNRAATAKSETKK
ncbi:MAG: DUF882 domain-containing protein [Methylocystis sp.]|uniref:DUF882 domain-containing protein n=1 Tax=Methylocystis sp. TaxID=1911079 RepID=UPI003DA37912